MSCTPHFKYLGVGHKMAFHSCRRKDGFIILAAWTVTLTAHIHRSCTGTEKEGGFCYVRGECTELLWDGHSLCCPGGHVTPSPLSFQKLLGDSFRDFRFLSEWGFSNTWKFQVCFLLSAAGKAGRLLSWPSSSGLLLGNAIYFPTVVQWTWSCFHAMPWLCFRQRSSIKNAILSMSLDRLWYDGN